jgi:periplasmic copper chaperone A
MPYALTRLLASAFVATAVGSIRLPAADAALPFGLAPVRTVLPGADRVKADGIMVEQAWARATPGNATMAAAYVTVTAGAQPDRLVGVSTPVAATADVHQSLSDAGVMKMRPVPALAIPAGATVAFSPGGYHIMLTGLKKPLVAGESFPLTFRFERGQPITVEVRIRPIGRDAADQDHMQMK